MSALRRDRAKQFLNDSQTKKLAGLSLKALPALSSLEQLPSLDDFDIDDDLIAAFTAAKRTLNADLPLESELYLGCVVRLDRGYPVIASKAGLCRAEFSAQLSKGIQPDMYTSRLAIGDWICLWLPKSHTTGVIEAILPRKTDLCRLKGKDHSQWQTLAANVDIAFIALALGAKPPRIEDVVRSAAVVLDAKIDVGVILTKSDRVDDEKLKEYVCHIKNAFNFDIPLIISSPFRDVSSIFPYIPPKKIGLILGQSGVGKSSFLNRLLDNALLPTSAVRETDDAGRHTTVARRMVKIPHAGILMDVPGVKTLSLAGHKDGLRILFSDIEEAAKNCRFSDCTHTTEPGCAVRSASSCKSLSEERLQLYRSLLKEI